MAEFRLGMLAYIRFDLVPVPFVIPDFFAGGTDGQHAAQCLDLGQRVLQIFNQTISLSFALFAFGDIADNAGVIHFPPNLPG